MSNTISIYTLIRPMLHFRPRTYFRDEPASSFGEEICWQKTYRDNFPLHANSVNIVQRIHIICNTSEDAYYLFVYASMSNLFSPKVINFLNRHALQTPYFNYLILSENGNLCIECHAFVCKKKRHYL